MRVTPGPPTRRILACVGERHARSRAPDAALVCRQSGPDITSNSALWRFGERQREASASVQPRRTPSSSVIGVKVSAGPLMPFDSPAM